MDMALQNHMTHMEMHQNFVNEVERNNNLMVHKRMMEENENSKPSNFKRFVIGLGIGTLAMVGVIAVASRLEK